MTMDTPAKILIVDDEEGIRFFLAHLLTRERYHVVGVESGERALEELNRQPFDMVLLDLMLEGIGGIEVLQSMRQQGFDTPVIVLTAYGSMETAIEALRAGAHDYLLKPCDAGKVRESVRTALVARERQQKQQALIRNVEQNLAASLEEIRASVLKPIPPREPAVVEATGPGPGGVPGGASRQGIVVDTGRHVILVDGHELDLSRTEFDLLAYLVKKAPQVITAQELVREVQGYASDRFEAADLVRRHIHRIRVKAEECAGRADIIRTVRGVGYALNGAPALVPPTPQR